MPQQFGIVTIDVSGVRYSAAYAVVDGRLEVSTGVSKLSVPIDGENHEAAALHALETLVSQNPHLPGIPFTKE